ncbi:MAG: HAD family hydrolase [archaeon]|nr:HAD family hydrolase [archaeon]
MGKLESIKIIIFDFDETLGKLDVDWDAMRLDIKNLLKENKIHFSGNGIHNMIAHIEDESIKKEAVDIIRKYELAGAKKSTVFECAEKTIKILHNSGFRLAIVTLNMKDTVNIVLEKDGLNNYFDFIDGFEINKKIKPEPDQIENIIADEDKELCIMVGDGVSDIIAANKAGIKGIGVLGGVNSEDELKKAGACCIISDVSELPDTLNIKEE